MDTAQRAQLDQLIASIEEVLAAVGGLRGCESACAVLRQLAERLRHRAGALHECPHSDGACCLHRLEAAIAGV